jgi:hypothetical protein
MRSVPRVLALFLTIAGIAPVLAQVDEPAVVVKEEYVLTGEDQPFIGHYYLSGIMETGSELLLRKDGRYQWYLSVGSMDQTSAGIWSYRNGKIVLLADAIAQAPLLSLGKLLPWSIEAERVVREDAIYAENMLVIEKCQFLSDAEAATAADSALSPPYQEITPELLAKARQADADELRLRKEYELAANNALAPNADQPAAHEIARNARLAWRAAWNYRRQTESDARLGFQTTPEPVLPKQCELNFSDGYVDADKKEEWTNGFAIQLIDPKTGTTFDRLPVTFLYSDGSQTKQITRGAGIAWVKIGDDKKVTGIVVDLSEALDLQPQTLSFDAVSQGMMPINVNGEYGAEQAFEVMQLTVDGKDLVAYEGRGKYQRAE